MIDDVVRLSLQLLSSSASSVGGDSLGTGRSRGGRRTSRLGNMVLDEGKQESAEKSTRPRMIGRGK
jgi:hypothetical protein